MGVVGVVLAGILAAAIRGVTRWPELPDVSNSRDSQLQWVSDPKEVATWRSWVGDPIRFARPGAPGFSDAIRQLRPVVTYQVSEYQTPLAWLDVGSTGERIGPLPSVGEPAAPRRPETVGRFPGETTAERLAATAPIPVLRGPLSQIPLEHPMDPLAPAPAGATIVGPTVVEFAVGPSGMVVLTRLSRSSGDMNTDQAALKAVRSIQFAVPQSDNAPILDAAGPLTWGEWAVHWTMATPP